jgi:hypothetical protein
MTGSPAANVAGLKLAVAVLVVHHHARVPVHSLEPRQRPEQKRRRRQRSEAPDRVGACPGRRGHVLWADRSPGSRTSYG